VPGDFVDYHKLIYSDHKLVGQEKMLLFGHIGITAGVVRACDVLVSMPKSGSSYQSDVSLKFGAVIGRGRLRLHYLLDGMRGRIGSIDYRTVFVGSLFPDIVDKSVWLFANSLNSDTYLSGRDYTHTLLFNLVLFIGGLVLIRYRKSWLLITSLASFMHLLLDRMWHNPVVLLWPLLGPLPKPEREIINWFAYIIQRLFSNPAVYVPEIIGLGLVSLFAYRLIMRKRVISFLRGGAIG